MKERYLYIGVGDYDGFAIPELKDKSVLLKTICISKTRPTDPYAKIDLNALSLSEDKLSWYYQVPCKLPNEGNNKMSHSVMMPKNHSNNQHGIVTLQVQ